MTPRRAVSMIAAVLIALGAFQAFYLQIFIIDRSALGATLTELPYRRLPGLRRFLLEVRARTSPGDVVAIDAGLPSWERGYEYCYGRATYLLAGRLVLPLRDRVDRRLSENLAQATHVASYRSQVLPPGFSPVWRSADGVLLRRTH